MVLSLSFVLLCPLLPGLPGLEGKGRWEKAAAVSLTAEALALVVPIPSVILYTVYLLLLSSRNTWRRLIYIFASVMKFVVAPLGLPLVNVPIAWPERLRSITRSPWK